MSPYWTMLAVKKARKSHTTVPLIVGERMDILVDDDIPILFTGINTLGNHVLGSFVEADYKKGIELFLHSVIDLETYGAFVNQKINYPTVLERAELLFLVSHGSAGKEIFPIELSDLPKPYVPLQAAFCPKLDLPPTSNYPIRLQGKWADLHTAVPEELAKLQTLLAEFFRNPFRRLNFAKLLNVMPVVKLLAGYQASSFKFDYTVELEKGEAIQQKLFSTEEREFSGFLNKYVSYCINDLPDEIEVVLDNRLNDAAGFADLRDAYGRLIGAKSEANIEQSTRRLRDEVIKAVDDLDDISDTVGDHYTQVAVSNLSTTGNENVLGTIGQGNRERIEELVSITATRTGRPKTVDDERDYRIFVYALNTDTRTGHAYLEEQIGNKAVRPKIRISGNESLAETRYTESMYKDEYITVRGRATRLGGIPKSIDIVYQP